MKAISLWQPWASAWMTTLKEFETRSWYTAHRGPLLIHAAKKRDGDVRAALMNEELVQDLNHAGLLNALPFGALIGIVDVIGCSQMSRMPEPSETERRWGDWHPTRYAWQRSGTVIYFPEPIPFKGAQGLFEVNMPLPDGLK
jgi:hypothetical protein